jgi:cell division protein ZapB
MNNSTNDAKNQVQRVALKVNELISGCEQLKIHNEVLQASQDDLISDKAKLIEKSELARQKVDAMITRLKAMEII